MMVATFIDADSQKDAVGPLKERNTRHFCFLRGYGDQSGVTSRSLRLMSDHPFIGKECKLRILFIEGNDKVVWCGEMTKAPAKGDEVPLEGKGRYRVLGPMVRLAKQREYSPDFVFLVEFCAGAPL